MTNYVLFKLSRRATVSEVNLTYSVTGSKPPKISVCAALNDTNTTNAFTTLTCQEVTIEATGGESRIIAMPFTNITNRVAMEVITQGIKASFTAISTHFFGTYEVIGK